MKVLFRKLKRTNKFLLTFFIISFLAYLVGYIIFTKSILSLTGIETLIRSLAISFFAIWLFMYLLIALIKLIKKRYKLFIILTIITALFSVVFYVGSYYINFLYNNVGDLSESKTINYTSYLISFKDKDFDSKSKIGMINNTKDIEGNILAKKIINKYHLKNEVVEYEDYSLLLEALYDKEVDAIFVSANYTTIFGSEEKYSEIGVETKKIYEFSELRKNEDLKLTSNKKLDKPFTVLVMGVDSADNGLNANAAFNGDTLILMTFNPDTLTASMFSVPRDTYVPIACRNNAYSKINSSAAYGSSCVIDTMENLTGIKIDYYVKINFKGVVDLVNAVGGVDVEVEEPDFVYNHGVNCKGKICEADSNRENYNIVYIDPGFQTLNGEQALAYARCRHLYIESDLARNKHQQDIISSLSKKALKIRSFDKFEEILDAISNNISTNMSTDQILSSYNILKDMLVKSLNGEEMVNIKRTYLEVYSLPVNIGSTVTSALGYYPGSLDEITKMMKVNLELEKQEPVKTFKYSILEDYQPKTFGKGITSGSKLELLPSFIGKSEGYVREWCNSHNISLTVSGDGATVVSQSKNAGTLIKNITSLSIDMGTKEIESNNITVKDTKKDDDEEIIIDENIKEMLN